MQCDSCAVVSSSGQLVNSSAGKYIDSYPCIIRMNSAPTSGFEEDVGSRTTVRVMGHVNLMKINSSMEEQQEIFINSSTRTNKMIIPWLFGVKSNKRRDKYYLIAKNFSEAYRSTEFYVLSSKKMVEAEKIFQAETGISRYSRLVFNIGPCRVDQAHLPGTTAPPLLPLPFYPALVPCYLFHAFVT